MCNREGVSSSSSYPSIFRLVGSFPSGIVSSHSFHCCITSQFTSQFFFFLIVMYVPFSVFCVLFVCKCVLYYCHLASTQLQLNNNNNNNNNNCQLLCFWRLALSIVVEVFPRPFFRILLLQGCYYKLVMPNYMSYP
jgi:hypothetical protein